MLFVHCINSKQNDFVYFKSLLLIKVLITSLFISSCSSTFIGSETEKLETSGKNLREIAVKQPIIKAKNAYLEQKEYLMDGVPKKVIAIYEQAIALTEQKKWHAALTLFDEVAAKQPSLSGSYVNQALIFKKLSDLESNKEKQQKLQVKSELLVDTAIKLNPLNPYAHYVKGQSLQDKGQFNQANKSFTRALTIWPDFAQAQLSLAVLLELYQGKLLAAHEYYAAYLINNNEDMQVKRWQGALLLKIKRAGLTLPIHQGG